ncbi:hypothetical protein CH275_10030 [Rhodococcus sp. 06-235-1A]|uniref:GntR family transcriptional regulator n=1 Tax=Rhodococcus sp. 06-235-1A TaxID=2022508 RepID=UPI000B9B627C|nr:GntR family transcriptional regulator [Rhodococcus sp. 06-235-1A]OZD06547.1 hypothetical protein CH275_10030 [Rhodococcus sp. 06-235-1A]
MTDVSTTALSQGLGRDITDLVRAMILDGTLKPGQVLLPRDLQAQFGVSTIPVREALRTLASEGFVVSSPRRRTRVAGVSMTELGEVYTLRRSIEPPLMRQSAASRTELHIRLAVAAFDDMDRHVGSDVNKFLAAHREFHRALLEPALGPLTERILRQLWLTSDRYVRLGVASTRVDERARDDHLTLLDSYSSGDAILAEQTARAHLQLVEQSVTGALGDLLN